MKCDILINSDFGALFGVNGKDLVVFNCFVEASLNDNVETEFFKNLTGFVSVLADELGDNFLFGAETDGNEEM